MMAAAQGEAVFIRVGDEVVRVGRVHDKTDQGAAGWRTDHLQPGDFSKALACVRRQRGVVGGNILAAERFDVIDRGAQADRLADRGSAGLEFVRRFLERARFERDGDDHLAAAVPRRHAFEKLAAAVKRAAPGRPAHLVP